MSTKISELSSLVCGIPATNAVPISVDGTTYKVNLGNLAEETASADVLTAIGAIIAAIPAVKTWVAAQEELKNNPV